MSSMWKKTTSLALFFAFILAMWCNTGALALGLETTEFTDQELQEIAYTDQLVDDYMEYLAKRPQTRAGDRVVLPMTPIRQSNGYYCGPAAACMVVETLGLGTYSQSEMAAITKTTTAGSSSADIADGLNSVLRDSSLSGRYQKTNTSQSNFIGSILYSINHGYPMIMNVKWMPEYTVTIGHFVAINGYYAASFGDTSTVQIYICDPHPDYCGSYLYTLKEMEKACNSAVGNFIRLSE